MSGINEFFWSSEFFSKIWDTVVANNETQKEWDSEYLIVTNSPEFKISTDGL